MRETLNFSAWLAAAPAAWFDRIARTRTDLLRTDAADIRRFSGLASSRAAAAAGLEMLDAAGLRVVHQAAIRSRIAPAVPRSELVSAHEGATSSPAGTGRGARAPLDSGLIQAIGTGLLWPASAGDGEEWPLHASAYRVHPEASGLLPVTAAARAEGVRWERAQDPRPFETVSVSAALLRNAQAAGAAGAVARTLAVVGEFARADVSQLVSGGVGKRDAQQLSRTLGISAERLILAAELAGRLSWLGVSTDPADPLWLPTPAYDAAVAAPREEVWARLVHTWLTHAVDVHHVRTGSTPAGERVHLLGRDDHSRSAFPGFPVARPQILQLRRLVLAALAGAEEGAAVHEEALLGLLRFLHPLLSVVDADELAQVLDETESFGLTASPLGHARAHALTPLGRQLATGPEGAELGPELSTEIQAAVAALLPRLETTVTVQSDLTAVASGPLDPSVQTRLEAFAEIDTRGQGTVFRITDDSLAAALRAGRDAHSLVDDVTQLSSTGVPSTVVHMIESQAQRLQRVRVASARSVIVVDDPADLDILFDDPAAAATGLRRLSATVAISATPSDRVIALVETEDRPVMSVDAEAQGMRPARAPVPAQSTPPVTRTSRVSPEAVADHIRVLEATRTGGASGAVGAAAGTAAGTAAARGARAGADSARNRGPRAGNAHAARAVDAESGHTAILAELSEAAAVRGEVELVAAGADGAPRRIRMFPEGVRAGRVLGRTAEGAPVRIAAARVIEVTRVRGGQ